MNRLLNIILGILVFLFTAGKIQADNTFPFKVFQFNSYPGGKLISSEKNPDTFFFLKQSWIANSETLVKWTGVSKNDLIGIDLGMDKVLDLFLDGKRMLLVGIRGNLIFCQVYNLNMELLSSIILDSLKEQADFSTKILSFNSKYLVLTQAKLWEINFNGKEIGSSLLFNKIDDFEIADSSIFVIEKHDQFIVLKEYDNSNSFMYQIRLESAEINKIKLNNDFVFVESSFSEINSTLIQIVTRSHFHTVFKRNFDVNSDLIDFFSEKFNPVIVFSIVNRNLITISKLTVDNSNILEETSVLEERIYEPLRLKIIKNQIFLITRNSLLRLDNNLQTNILYLSQYGRKLGNNPTLNLSGSNLIISSDNYSELLEIKENPMWFLYYIYHNLLRYIIPIILLIISLIFIKLYQKQKKVFTELLNLPSANIFIILNSKGNVEYLSAKARELLMIDPAVNFNVPLPTLLSNQIFEPILYFYENAIKNPSYLSQKLTIINQKEAREYIFSISPYFAVSGTLNGHLINAFDITEQLERKKMTNWAQLAHDMQTNLLTIKLNAEQMSCEEMTENYDRKKRILHQVNLLQKRVRDIVTIGRSTNLELVQTNTYDIMSEAASEFDRVLFPNIDISVICEKIDLFCDKPKILRAIRNCIENGIKAIPDSVGRIDLNAWNEGKMICLSIKDNGKGMDEVTKKKFLEPYFSTSKDGSGFGIGTIIIQQAVELHNGKIEIKSKMGAGSEIILKLPRIRKN